MAQRRAVITVYAVGVAQGLALVTFPAASTILMASDAYGLSHSAYGAMFVPLAVMAIGASLFGGTLDRILGPTRVYLLGLLANALSMALLLLSIAVMHRHGLAYGVLLGATGFMGLGFGWTVPALNTFAAQFFPKAANRAVLILNALLGLGTLLAPILIAILSRLGCWWVLPALVGSLVVALLLCSLPQHIGEGPSQGHDGAPAAGGALPRRFWLFAAFACLYGMCETMNATWAPVYMTTHAGADATVAALALTAFWGMVMAGRLLSGALERWVSGALAYRILPGVMVLAFIACAMLPQHEPWAGIAVFAVAGFGCSALLPLTISHAQSSMAAISATVASSLIAAYQIGYGIAAFGVGPLQTWTGAEMSTIYGGCGLLAIAMGILSFIVIPLRQPTPR
jgi:MFS family permease